MDPFTGFSLATGVITFVDFSWKLMTETREIAKSMDGRSEDTMMLELILKNIEKADLAIDETPISTDQKDTLNQIVQQCRNVSTRLKDVLQKLTVAPGHSHCKSFTVALKGVCKNKEIESLFETITRLRSQVIDHLNTLTFQRVSGLVDKVSDMDASWKRLEMQSRAELHLLTTQVANMISAAKGAQNSLDILVQTATSRRRELQNGNTGLSEAWKRAGQPLLIEFDDGFRNTVSATKAIDLPKMLALAKKIEEEGPRFESDLEFLDSLTFRGIRARQKGIKLAHSATFEWIFEDTPTGNSCDRGEGKQLNTGSQSTTKAKDSRYFSRWLKKEGGIFWIHGKPGSGKSTLMKFISSHDKTKRKLEQWAYPKQVQMAHYYFWASGSQLQRSQTGLLRSLIFEMIRKCPELLSVAKTTIPEVDSFESDNERWTLEQLLRTYKAIATQALGTRFCFFIDGLDEYHDSERKPQDLVRTIRELELSDDVKLCISSRPYPIFDEEFGGDRERILRIEAHSLNDIRRYVSDKFEATGNFTSLEKQDPAYSEFVSEVAERAQGVFLWVVLVVASLENGISNADSVVRLRARLDTYPPDLDDFFLAMLKSVQQDYRRQAMRTFEIVATALRPLHAMVFWYLYIIDDEPGKIDMWKTEKRMQKDEEVNARLKSLRRIIQARSQGLLEVLEDEDGHAQAFFRFRVNFIHRTVRDFLRTSKSVREQFKTELKGETRSTWMIACHALLAVLKDALTEGSDEVEILHDLVRDIFFYAAQEAASGEQSTGRLAAERWVGYAENLFNDYKETLNYPQTNSRLFLCLEAQYNFQDRLKKRLKEYGTAAERFDGKLERPVLLRALVPFPGEGPIHYSEKIVKALLKKHADPKELYQEKTVWVRFVSHMADLPSEMDPQVRQALVAIVKVILAHDNKCLKLMVDTEGGSRPAEMVLRDIFTKEELPQLKKKWWLPSLFA
ncbi:hypothetical protein B0I35DRAFT_435724 [Stachybotrys elegans]|uniref:NACHT domain-containing protein n=1 Tax=Stachybotrys elegans TaxID=80388 RepID=A0A8K0SJ77_9HYPO|nr:hypothetical protein B0I35DRAFT_435724 [Stachybotrys elegans]